LKVGPYTDIGAQMWQGMRMFSAPEWLKLWLIACRSQIPDTGPTDATLAGAIGFRCGEVEYKIDMQRGMMLESAESVTCWIEGSSEAFDEIALGALNLQKALVQGKITVQGSPMQLLAVSQVVDAGIRINRLQSVQITARRGSG
jgi:putative sterol carrier protein